MLSYLLATLFLMPTRADLPAPRADGLCSLGACDGAPAYARGICEGHYYRWRTGGDLTSPVRRQFKHDGPCLVIGCSAKGDRRGVCRKHYNVWKNGSEINAPGAALGQREPCGVKSCPHHARGKVGLCAAHYTRHLQGIPMDPPVRKHTVKRGDGHITEGGYRQVYRHGKTVLEHRWVAAQALGRELDPSEDVHHRNGDKLDNAVDGPFRLDHRGNLVSGNLEIWLYAKRQPRGQEVGPRLDYLLDVLERYVDTLDDERRARLEEVAARTRR